MITPSALNLLIVLCMMIIASFLWRAAAAKLSDNGSPFGDAMGTML